MATIDYKQQLHPQMSEVLEKQAEIVPGARKVHELDANDARRQYARGRQYWNADAPEVAEIIESRVEGPAGRGNTRIPRTIRPGRPRSPEGLRPRSGGFASGSPRNPPRR